MLKSDFFTLSMTLQYIIPWFCRYIPVKGIGWSLFSETVLSKVM